MTEALIQGLLLGGFYAILAAGLSLMFGVMRIINAALTVGKGQRIGIIAGSGVGKA